MGLLTSLLTEAGVSGAVNYKGTWNATTNVPTLASGVGTQGDYYVVSVAGTTTLDGISSWDVGDWAIFNGSAWQQVDNSELWARTGTQLTPANSGDSLLLATGLSSGLYFGDGDTSIYENADDNIYFDTAGVTGMRIDGNQNVSIGTTSIPVGARLNVDGTVLATIFNSQGAAYINGATISRLSAGSLFFNGDMEFRNDAGSATNVFFEAATGNVGIGTTSPNTKLDVQGGQTVKVTTVNAATYDLLITDYILHVTYTTTGACTITIPTAQTTAGRTIIIKDAGNNAGTNNITVDTEGTEKIEFSTSDYEINGNGVSIKLYSDGTDWFIGSDKA